MAVWVTRNGLDCQHCTQQRRKIWGCDGFDEPKETNILGRKILIDKCPKKIIGVDENELLFAHALYSKGFLPNGGSWLNESIVFTNNMVLIDSIFAEVEIAESKKVTKG